MALRVRLQTISRRRAVMAAGLLVSLLLTVSLAHEIAAPPGSPGGTERTQIPGHRSREIVVAWDEEPRALAWAFPEDRRLPPAESPATRRLPFVGEPQLAPPSLGAGRVDGGPSNMVTDTWSASHSPSRSPLAEPLPPGLPESVPPGEPGERSTMGSSSWWQSLVIHPLLRNRSPQPARLEDVILIALGNSPHVQALGDEALIAETAITEASAAFDTRTFLESRYVSLSDPVGNTLTTGGPNRYRDQDYKLSGGLRKKTSYGGNFEFSQKIGAQHTNSLYFVPPYQGNARLSLSFTQPILRGAGSAYNQSLIVLAEIDTRATMDRVSAELQDHLMEVTQAYWQVHLARAVYLQRKRWVVRAEAILVELESRREVDAMASQIARARAAVSSRSAELARAVADIENSEARLRVLTGDPGGPQSRVEIIPMDSPLAAPIRLELNDALVTAVQCRPEINQALDQIRAAQVRLGVSQNELLPVLDMVLEGYVAGLAGDYEVSRAFGDQFSTGQPGYTAGLQFEMPWGNRAAIARNQRRKLELRRSTRELQDLLNTYRAEVEVAVREVETTFREVLGHASAISAVEADIGYLEERWRLLPGDDRSRGFLLDDLLSAQDRLALEERALAQSQTMYTVSLAEFRRATGTLLQYEQVVVVRQQEGNLPVNVFEKQGTRGPD